MAFVMSQEGGVALLQWMLGVRTPILPTCHLLGSPYTPHISSTLSLFAAAEVHGVGGYAPIQLTSPKAWWTLAGLPDGDQATYITLSWTFTAAVTVYGYYLSDDTLAVSLLGELLAQNYPYGSSGGVFALVLNLQLNNAVGVS